MEIQEAIKLCKEFATDHKLIFQDTGECGFGRECVGFVSQGGNWLDYNPYGCVGYEPIAGLQCDAVEPPDDVDAYHKHTCMAVLGRGDGAIIELAEWVNSINSAGNVEVVSYPTGATGPQDFITGVTGYCVLAGERL